MPRVFDNLQADSKFLDALQQTLVVSSRADFCVGYFNLRGWQSVDPCMESWRGGEGHCCRLLVGMQRLPHEELRTARSLLRNREGRRYRAIQEYVRENDSLCILLSATPYNKSYLDLSSQLRLFVPEHDDLGIRPERLLRDIGETEFVRRHQAPVRSLAAFEQSQHADDWRDLMRLYLVRRTRNFIQDNYAADDEADGRKYLSFEDGQRFYI